jgi:aspartyl-tRNA(Asn)/glutamyl-tRNA(Gln) amidotransferase subunit B
MNKGYEVIIGLEVHVQLDTNSKIFCSCSTEFDSPPNTNICPVCCGYPGVLPVLNKKALELAIRACIALNCKINRKIYFERKNYFYPDLPKNYQISQYELPLGEEGFLEIESGKKIGIKRVHLEEDAGKLIHKENYSLIDFNRTGIPLLEIVTHPDIRSPQEAFSYLNQLKLTIQYIGASSCDMEKGILRCDANISLKEKDKKDLGVKVELKNMNTFRGVRDALDYEVKRQSKLLAQGRDILQETRLWDPERRETILMRTKEEACDYRYFPEPDLVNFSIEEEMIERERLEVGELPSNRKRRFLDTYHLDQKEVDILISNKWLADFFEESCKEFDQPKSIANWLTGPFLELIYNLEGGFERVKLSPANFSKIVRYFCEDRLNNLAAKKVLAKALSTNRNIDQIIKEEGLLQVSEESQLIRFVEEAVRENSKTVSDYLGGKKSAIQFLVGCVMKKTKGRANPKVVKEMLTKRLEGKEEVKR